MRLDNVLIYNFRSIKDGGIHFDHQCRVLVGINESGKSNLLDALSLLSSEYEPRPEDEREPLPDEKADEDKEAGIYFVFDMTDEEEDLYNRVLSKIVSEKDMIIIKEKEKELTVKDCCKLFKEGIFYIDIRENQKYPRYWQLDISNYELMEGWAKPNSNVPDDFEFVLEEQNFNLKEVAIIKPKEEWNIPADYLSNAGLEDVLSAIEEELCNQIGESLPKVIYWKYSDEQLLPEQIELQSFIDDPDTCIPLKNMFYLAGKEEIKDEVESAQNKRRNALENLLAGVAKKNTEYFRKVWKDYEDIEFSLVIDGDFLRCSVMEKNKFSFQQRSDGFKKFVTFLLTVSARVETGELKNALILIDEPEIGLHPSGARYLRDELIKLSKDNYVVYSTHSIFMIDRNCIERHLIIIKKNEITEIQPADEDNIVKEEVIFNALNYSVFQHLKEINIIFEGQHDKKLFETVTKRHEKTFFKEIGAVPGDGVSSLKNLIRILELAERKVLIVTDNDTPAKNQQKEYQKLDYKSEWKRYDEISSDITAKTGEDFLTKDHIISTFKKVMKKHNKNITLEENSIPPDGRLNHIKGLLKKKKYNDTEVKKIIKEELKPALFDKLTSSKIEDSYIEFLDNLKIYIQSNLINSE